MSSIKPEDVQKHLSELFSKYEGQVEDVVKDSTQKVSQKVKPELQGYSKKGGHLYRTGVYRSGWAQRVVSKKDAYQIKTYNAKKPTLVHLLEFGHDGPIKAQAYPHVRQTELKYLGILMEELEKGVNK